MLALVAQYGRNGILYLVSKPEFSSAFSNLLLAVDVCMRLVGNLLEREGDPRRQTAAHRSAQMQRRCAGRPEFVTDRIENIAPGWKAQEH